MPSLPTPSSKILLRLLVVEHWLRLPKSWVILRISLFLFVPLDGCKSKLGSGFTKRVLSVTSDRHFKIAICPNRRFQALRSGLIRIIRALSPPSDDCSTSLLTLGHLASKVWTTSSSNSFVLLFCCCKGCRRFLDELFLSVERSSKGDSLLNRSLPSSLIVAAERYEPLLSNCSCLNSDN